MEPFIFGVLLVFIFFGKNGFLSFDHATVISRVTREDFVCSGVPGEAVFHFFTTAKLETDLYGIV